MSGVTEQTGRLTGHGFVPTPVTDRTPGGLPCAPVVPEPWAGRTTKKDVTKHTSHRHAPKRKYTHQEGTPRP